MRRIINSRLSTIKLCCKCKIQLTEENSKPYNNKSGNYICNNCFKLKQIESREKRNKYTREADLKIKLKMIEGYGGKCNCCGESRYQFLTIDHINNDGADDRRKNNKTGIKLYRDLIKQNFPKDRFQLLCFNCNCAKGFFGKCPHEDEKLLH